LRAATAECTKSMRGALRGTDPSPSTSLRVRISPAGSRYAHARKTAQVQICPSRPIFLPFRFRALRADPSHAFELSAKPACANADYANYVRTSIYLHFFL
jgi:hypothetical protein